MKSLISPPFNSTAVILRTTTCHYRGAGMKLLFLPLPQFQSLNTDSPPLTHFFKTVEKQPKTGANCAGACWAGACQAYLFWWGSSLGLPITAPLHYRVESNANKVSS